MGVYRNLSASHALLPRTIALSMDGDKRDELQDSKVLKNAFGDVLHFLPRRCYENYLLVPAAISWLLNEQIFFQNSPTTEQAVSTWMSANGNKVEFEAPNNPVFSSEWLSKVDAAKLLKELFQDLSQATEIYRKTLHSPQLTRWLIENEIDSLTELIAHVTELVPLHHRIT